MWTYTQPDELYHYGVVGMKWGVRRYQPAGGSSRGTNKKRNAKMDKAFEQNIKGGKDKPNISPAEKIAKNASSTIDDVSKIHNARTNLKNRKSLDMDLSNMTDAELRERINRMNLEKQYSNLTSEQVKSGQQYARDVLDIASGVVGITASVIGTIALIKSLS